MFGCAMVPPGWSAFLLPLLMASFTLTTGQHGDNRGYRVTGTNHTTAAMFPHHALIVALRKPWDPKVCGGSLVAPQWVLSSAHCLRPCSVTITYSGPEPCYTYYRVILGASDLYDQQQMRLIGAAVFMDPAHSTGSMFELALVMLDRPTEWTDSIHPVSLPWNLRGKDLESRKIFFTGWGLRKDKAGEEDEYFGDDELGVGLMTALSQWACYGYTFIPKQEEKGFLCTTGDRPCPGDVGGALVVANEHTGRWIQVAASTGPAYHSCERSAVPILHTRLEPYLPWIQRMTKLRPE